MSSGQINPFNALASGVHSGGSGFLAQAISHGRTLQTYAAMAAYV
jgi:hypothetical protein